MIIDLAERDVDTSLVTDVLVIGAGIAGLLLADRLRHLGVRVAVIESGGREQVEETHPSNQVVLLGDRYKGATHGRFRCIGGTSTRWGGALLPFREEDLAARPHIGFPAWPVGMGTVRPYLADIEALFGVDTGSYEENFVKDIGAGSQIPTGDPDFVSRFAKWPVFRNRNVATLLSQRIERDPDFPVWINATATHFNLDKESGRLRVVTARHQNGKTVTISASHVAVCAGAIESTRLLLLLNRQNEGEAFKNCDALGRFFYDHISVPMATIRARQVIRLNRMAGYRFAGTTMRNLRFELSPAAQESEGVLSAFGHISFETEGATGFDALREFLRSLQQSGRIQPHLVLRVLQDLPYLVRAGFWRYFHKQLYWPTPAKYTLHVVAEQAPRPDNVITLATERDEFGLPMAAIDWRIREPDCMVFSAFCHRFDGFWKRHGMQAIGDLEWLAAPDAITTRQIAHGGDIYHPGGTTRMGTNARSAVVDQDLRTHAVSNLWVASTSVFPSGASANPTLMLMLFTMRLADHLKQMIADPIA